MVFPPLVKAQVIENPLVRIAEEVDARGDERGLECRQKLARHFSGSRNLYVAQASEGCEFRKESWMGFGEVFRSVQPQILEVDQKWNGLGELLNEVCLRVQVVTPKL